MAVRLRFPNQSGSRPCRAQDNAVGLRTRCHRGDRESADLPTQSRLGAIFAEPAEVRADVYRETVDSAPIISFNLLPNPLWNRGVYNYGSSWSYYYPGPYYGGPYVSYAVRLPYVCGLYGYCF
jgi:hypothetical protein